MNLLELMFRADKAILETLVAETQRGSGAREELVEDDFDESVSYTNRTTPVDVLLGRFSK